MGRRARRSPLRSALFSAGRRWRQPFPARTCLAPTTQRTPDASFPANSCFGPYISPSDCTGELAGCSPSPRRWHARRHSHRLRSGTRELPPLRPISAATDPSCLEASSLPPPVLSAERIAHRRRRRRPLRRRLLLFLRHGDRLAALGHDEGENLGGLGQACIGRNGVQLARRFVEGLAFGQDGFGAL